MIQQQRTRVKYCGFTRVQDIHAAVNAGVDALGFVFYDKSPRYVSPEKAGELMRHVPAFITTVGLFVNASMSEISAVLQHAPVQCVQLHGDETWDFAIELQQVVKKPVIKAVRVNENTDWLTVAHHVSAVSSVLLDADSVGYGGSGHRFDWAVIPERVRGKIILSGGLSDAMIGTAVQTIHPYALDVSSGIESGFKGVKDADKMQIFAQAVRDADAERWRIESLKRDATI